MLGVLIKDSDVGIPGRLGGVVGGEGGAVLRGETATGGPDGLGDHGWEVSHGSQVEFNAVVFTVVLGGGEGGSTTCLDDVAGNWDVGDVTVELGLDSCELEADSRCVDDWGLAGGTPVAGHAGFVVNSGGTLTVPGSEGLELRGWHGEEWEHGVSCEAGTCLNISTSCCSRSNHEARLA